MKKKILFLVTSLFICACIFAGSEKYGKVSAGTINWGNMDSTRILKTKTGKTIIINETHPYGLSRSLIVIIPEDFTNNDSIKLGETDPIMKAELTDLDNDGFEELFIFTQSAGSGSSENVYGYASDRDVGLVKIDIAPIPEDEYREGGLFEGYMGHDNFYFESGMLVREFPVYKSNDINIAPTGGIRELYYKYKDFRLEKAKIIKKGHS